MRSTLKTFAIQRKTLTVLTDNRGVVQGLDRAIVHCTSDTHPNADEWKNTSIGGFVEGKNFFRWCITNSINFSAREYTSFPKLQVELRLRRRQASVYLSVMECHGVPWRSGGPGLLLVTTRV